MLRLLPFVCALLVLGALGPGSPADIRAQGDAVSVGDVEIVINQAEVRSSIEVPTYPIATPLGQYLVIRLTATNNGGAAVDYDFCPPDVPCLSQTWFQVADAQGAAYDVDMTATTLLEQGEDVEETLRFGEELPPSASKQIVLVFDVPTGAVSWTLVGSEMAPAPFSLPVVTSVLAATPTAAVIEAGMNETVPLGDVEIMATLAYTVPTIEVPRFPIATALGQFMVVRVAITNLGTAPVEYDVCPPSETVCINQSWFQIVDDQGQIFSADVIATSLLDAREVTHRFGAEIPADSQVEVDLAFDVTSESAVWSLDSTEESPQPFSIRLDLSAPPETGPAPPGSIRVITGTGGGDSASGGDGGRTGGGVAVELILDTSGSMLQELEGRLRIDVAKDVLTNLVTNTLPPGTPLALRVFGTEPGSCETTLALPLQPLDPAAVSGQIAQLQSVNEVKTPIGAALAAVADDLKDVAGPKVVILVTDGEETCGGNAEAEIRALIDAGIDVRVNIVGFAVDDQALKAQFQEWARLGNGQYYDAIGADELDAALTEAVQSEFRVLDSDGSVVGTGVVNGDPVSVAPGTYTVEVQGEEPRRIDDVVVESDQSVDVNLDDAT